MSTITDRWPELEANVQRVAHLGIENLEDEAARAAQRILGKRELRA